MENRLTFGKIFRFWAPLAATWLMMSSEGPFISAVIARLAEPKFNLAAYGVAFSFALILEAPVIMMLTASTALVTDRRSFYQLRKFAFLLNGVTTFLMLLLLIPPIFRFVTMHLIGLPEPVSRLTHLATLILLPWPGAIGYRRFYQGILIRHNLTRRVAYGTGIRLTAMASTALLGYFFLDVPGVMIGAMALSTAVLIEAVASRLMANRCVEYLLKQEGPSENSGDNLTLRGIWKFYYPLALTVILALGVYPVVTFFMGQSRMGLESLAAFPVVNSLVFMFRSLGLSYQEVGIALMGKNNEGYEALKRFAVVLGFAISGTLALIAFTPLAKVWFHHVSGLSPALTEFAIPPTRIMIFLPALTLLLSFQRAILVHLKNTTPITTTTLIEIAGIVLILFTGIHLLNAVGIIAAALAFVIGRTGANVYLLFKLPPVERTK